MVLRRTNGSLVLSRKFSAALSLDPLTNDPELAEVLCPDDYPFGTKRPCLDTGYYETFNRVNVRLVDLRKTPLVSMDEAGVSTSDEHLTSMSSCTQPDSTP